jgi:RNA polymerase sigma-70 factor (ECF subfamily)
MSVDSTVALITTDDFDARYPRLFADLTRLGYAMGAGHEAEDIAQDVLLDGRQHLGQLREAQKLQAWLRRMMVRACWRRLRQRRSNSPDVTAAYVPLDRSDVLDLATAVAQLPPRERLAIGLVYGLGYSQVEAATVMGISRGGLASSLFKARIKLAREVEVEVEAR